MILVKCIFSQSATGEVSSAYFRKLVISRFSGWGVQIFANEPNARLCRDTLTRGQPDMRPASTSKKPEEEEEPEFDSSGDEIPYVKRSRRR